MMLIVFKLEEVSSRPPLLRQQVRTDSLHFGEAEFDILLPT